MADDFSVVAIIAAFNEADVIGAVVRDLIDQGISIYFLDDGSTDGTVQAVEPYVGRGVIQIEQLRDTASASAGAFHWEQILRRKAQLASELDADWFIHHDADEFRESPWADVPLSEAIRRVDSMGYNAIDFASLDFRPTHDRFRPGDDPRPAFPFYSAGALYDRLQIRCWKNTGGVELESTGGHDTQFEGRKVFPIRFLLRHYPIRGQAHGDRKVFVERQPRFSDAERARGWHVQYDNFVQGASFIHDPRTLTRFDAVGVRIGLSLRHRGVEALEQSLEGVRGELEAARSEIEARTKDIERLQEGLQLKTAENLARTNDIERLQEGLQLKTAENLALRQALEQRKVEVDNLQTAVTDFTKQLDALRRSLSWRWTAPARTVLRLLTGR